MYRNISGIILAGGENKRFSGVIKPLLVIEGSTILSRIISVFKELYPEIIIVTNKPTEFADYSQYRIVQDEFAGTGPLGGIHAGLKAVTGDAAFVIAGDMPFPDKEIISILTDAYLKTNPDALVPEIGSYIEPLHAIYSRSILESLETYLSSESSKAVQVYLAGIRSVYHKMKKSGTVTKAFTNYNHPRDYLS